MNAKELFIHDSRKWQSAERVHARLVNTLRVFVLTLELEGKVVCKMAAFMVASQQPESIWIPDLECPEIEHAL